MLRLDKSLRAWGTPGFKVILKQEIEQAGASELPLQQGLSTGNYVADEPFTVAINSVAEQDNTISVKASVFYKGVIGGCSCEGDPTPSSEINEYCEIQLDIDKTTAATAVTLVPEPTD